MYRVVNGVTWDIKYIKVYKVYKVYAGSREAFSRFLMLTVNAQKDGWNLCYIEYGKSSFILF